MTIPPNRRKVDGLEALLREVFPIYSYDKTLCLEYVSYELGRPRYTVEECRKLRVTYGYPFKIRVRLVKPEPVEEEIYLGEIPIMIGGGEFIVNGSERVTVSQLHRSPGVDFSVELHTGEKKLHSLLDHSRTRHRGLSSTLPRRTRSRFASTSPASSRARRCCGRWTPSTQPTPPSCVSSTTSRRSSRKKTDPEAKFAKALTGTYAVGDIVDAASGRPVCAFSGEEITEEAARAIAGERAARDRSAARSGGLPAAEHAARRHHQQPRRSAAEDLPAIAPGQPAAAREGARTVQREVLRRNALPPRSRWPIPFESQVQRWFDPKDQPPNAVGGPTSSSAIKYILGLRLPAMAKSTTSTTSAIAAFARFRSLAGDEFRKGFLKLRRTAQERMNLENVDTVTPRNLINSKTFSSAIEYFFARGELSQVVDQTNPLSQLTHERRLSALGPGGLNRKRAGFEVRDVHTSHYGRLCPIETPEGTNIGLISSSLAIYSSLDDYGFLTTLRTSSSRTARSPMMWCGCAPTKRATRCWRPADTAGRQVRSSSIADDQGRVIARVKGDPASGRIQGRWNTWTSATKQVVGVSASLIPFLEHDDANRALMGSNMQRQAVPLLRTDAPVVGTGMEEVVAQQLQSMVVRVEEGRHRHRGGCQPDHRRRRCLQAAQVRGAERAHLPKPDADRQARRQG